MANRNSISAKDPSPFVLKHFRVYAESAKRTDQEPYPFNATQSPGTIFCHFPSISPSLPPCPIRRESDCRKCGLKKALSRSLPPSLFHCIKKRKEGRKLHNVPPPPPPSYVLRRVSIGEYDACVTMLEGRSQKSDCQIQTSNC